MMSDRTEIKKIPLLVCAQCSNPRYFECGKAIRCPDHPYAELEESERNIHVQFFDGCGVVGLSRMSNYERPELYCKVSYDKEQGCWVWVENLPPDRKTSIIVSLDPSEEVKYSGPYIDQLVQTPYVYSGSTSISYSPGNRVGHIRYSALNGIFGKRFHSCPFKTSDQVKASFYPDGSVGLRFTDVSKGKLGTFHEELYRRLIGEVFRIRYEEDKGWMWVNQRVRVLEDYIQERKKKDVS